MFNSEKTNKYLFVLACVIIVGSLLISFVIDKTGLNSQRAEYVSAEQDSLEFLAQNSDIIALAMISGAPGTGDSRTKIFSTKSVTATATKFLKNNNQGKEFTILTSPFYLKRPTIKQIIAIYDNYYYLVFLKQVAKGEYKPLTGESIIEIVNRECRPIWKQPKESKFVEVPAVPQEEVINEIMVELNKTNKR